MFTVCTLLLKLYDTRNNTERTDNVELHCFRAAKGFRVTWSKWRCDWIDQEGLGKRRTATRQRTTHIVTRKLHAVNFLSKNSYVCLGLFSEETPCDSIPITRFHSRGQDLCNVIGTNESVCVRKELNPHRIGLGHQHGRLDVKWKPYINLCILAGHFNNEGLTVFPKTGTTNLKAKRKKIKPSSSPCVSVGPWDQSLHQRCKCD